MTTTRMTGRTTQKNESCSSGDDSDDSDDSDDYDDSDDSDELKEPPAKRVTRHSQGVAKTPDARSLRRLTRSRD